MLHIYHLKMPVIVMFLDVCVILVFFEKILTFRCVFFNNTIKNESIEHENQ